MGAQVWINGVDLTSTLALVPIAIARDLPDFSQSITTPDANVVYRVLADRSVVQTTQPFVDVELREIPVLAGNQDLLLGTSIRSGDVEVVHVNIPAPGVAGLLALSGMLCLRRRR
jgi:hypothetical protein